MEFMHPKPVGTTLFARRATMQPKDLTTVLKGAKPGEWLALSMDRTQLVGRGDSPQAATDSAKKAGHENIVLFHVPLPNVGIAAPAL